MTNFFVLILKDYDIAENTIHYIQVNHLIEKLKTKNAEAEENLKKAEFNFMVGLKTVIHKTSIDTKLLRLKMSLPQTKISSPRRILSRFQWTYRRLRFTICGRQNCFPRRIKEAGGGNTTFRKSQLNENAGREQHVGPGREKIMKTIVKYALNAWVLVKN